MVPPPVPHSPSFPKITAPDTDSMNTPSKPLLFQSGSSKRTRPACKFFASGSCAAGDLCPFQHVNQNIADACAVLAAENMPDANDLDIVSDSKDASDVFGTKEPADGSGTTGDVEKKFSYLQLAEMGGATPKGRRAVSQVVCLDEPQQEQQELCVFAVTGKCRFGRLCRNIHGLQCPRCLLYCLHPYDLEQNEEHIRECLEKPVKATSLADEDIECGICLERVTSKADPRFGLLNCEHAFCLSCIRLWRNPNGSHQSAGLDLTAIRSCPLCRIVTYFIIPSSTFVRDGEEKARIIEAYKKKLQVIPCRHWDFGRGRCPFGASCFYSHLLPDGTAPPIDGLDYRAYYDANEQVRAVREFRLSDFLPPS